MPIFEHEHYSRLFNMQFPVLETLVIGPGCHSISGATVSDPVCGQLARQFSKFLIAHSTITSLTLSYDDDIEPRTVRVTNNKEKNYFIVVLRWRLRQLPIDSVLGPATYIIETTTNQRKGGRIDYKNKCIPQRLSEVM